MNPVQTNPADGRNLNKILSAILSMSLLTVMAGAAIAPSLGSIREHFAESPLILVQLIISIPALFIILTNFAFPYLCRRLRTRTIAVFGLILYVVAGCVPVFVESVGAILFFRALLGVSVGLVMPLSTGLLSYYFPLERQAGLMGLSAAMNQMGGVVATLLAGVLSSVKWNYSFWVYALGVLAIALICAFLPNDKILSRKKMSEEEIEHKLNLPRRLLKFHPSVCGMLLCMSLFFVFPSNFSIIAKQTSPLTDIQITVVMVGLDVVAFFVGLLFGRLMELFRRGLKYFAPVGFGLGYACYIVFPSLFGMILGSVLIGLANGIGVPYLNTIASIKGGKTAATTVMPLLSMSLYAGQFLSPFILTRFGHFALDGFFENLGMSNLYAPYGMAVLFSIVYLVQAFATSKYQRLPPE